MKVYVFRRLAQFVPVLLLGMVAVWGMAYALPGSPTAVLGGDNATPAQIAAIRTRLGLDHPIWQQFFTWLGHAIRGQLGNSLISGQSVASLVASRIPATVQLAVLAIILVVVLAIPLGLTVGIRPKTWYGRAANTVLATTLAIPNFWLGLLLILVFAVRYAIFPAAPVYVAFWHDPVAALRNTLLPALAVGIRASSVVARFIAAATAEVMASDYIRTARAKGSSEYRVVFRHALRNALLPAVTILGLEFGALLGGAVVVEVVFTYPGLGRLLYTAITERDYSLLQGAVLFVIVVFLVLNLLVDLLYAYLDPRVRLSR